ncbi:MAG TPA: fumarate hydratase [Candidatus Cloacimonadota bacterium]|nr:fumarate hydratase [Candidatus Cloacimonadota bacterium]
MRDIDLRQVKELVKKAFIEANYHLNHDVRDALDKACLSESNPKGKEVLQILTENYKIADEGNFPLCQDTGVAVIFCEIGQDIHFTNGDLNETLNNAVAEAYDSGFLRKSIVESPLYQRINTRNNTPAIIHYEIKSGDCLNITVMPKGGGSENMSCLAMLKPSDGEEGLINLVVNHIRQIKGNPCPPIIVGIGIGGNFETSALLAKKSLITEIDSVNPDPILAELEQKLMNLINETGIGPMGLGGNTTCLKVSILTKPCHIASLPVAINIECHAHRFKKISF